MECGERLDTDGKTSPTVRQPERAIELYTSSNTKTSKKEDSYKIKHGWKTARGRRGRDKETDKVSVIFKMMMIIIIITTIILTTTTGVVALQGFVSWNRNY